MKSLRSLLGFSLLSLPLFGAGGDVRVEITDDKGTPVADAVASLRPLDTPPAIQPPTEPVLVVQQDQEFLPYVTAVVVGTQISFPNRDRVQHHVYSLSAAKPFELPLYRDEPHQPVRFDRPGVVALGCNIHDWMAAYIVVLPTPFFATTPANGIAPLAALPPGRYQLEVWHPRIAAVVTREVTVDPNDQRTQVITVKLKPDRRIRRAPEMGGSGAYR
ncbi:carboxypeptidase regulatory-like domain-containing protein [Opitutus terrae]|uniref:Methylamine utilization protein n=1 Tax=Opitutus terrae (strain DSM 11246 / JCM 15787 / PB90-1) TaxID=452637 RepID=B1ZMB5_OPITP|nr:carboxypeptidase regulatory-like domain-containing protein [Opitutus terrae]ACB73368.1 hypothetical protein Oter_0077 [Opitutus terrae PB90-1]